MSKRSNEREQLSLFRALPGSDMAVRDAQDDGLSVLLARKVAAHCADPI